MNNDKTLSSIFRAGAIFCILVFANGPGDLGSIPSRVIPKTLKMVLDTSLLNTQQYKVNIKGKVEQSRERSVVVIEKEAFWSPSTTVANFIYLHTNIYFLFLHYNNSSKLIVLSFSITGNL